jgi:hypothetical protein
MKAIPSKMHSLSSLGVDSSEKEVIQEYKNSRVQSIQSIQEKKVTGLTSSTCNQALKEHKHSKNKKSSMKISYPRNQLSKNKSI